MTAAGEDNKVISYTDYVGLLMSSVSTIINAISYILIAFVGISLVVSSIMIGIITYISVLERTKEIGILRSIGASKRDISRVFNAETLIVGFSAGMIGIIVTILINIPINILIKHLTDISGVAKLPPAGAVILVMISMLLTVIAGLFPSRIASKKTLSSHCGRIPKKEQLIRERLLPVQKSFTHSNRTNKTANDTAHIVFGVRFLLLSI